MIGGVHLRLEGGWDTCADVTTCPLAYHVPGLSLAEVERAPAELLAPILHACPDEVDRDWLIAWHNPAGRWHRDYDLPAVIYGDGERRWFREGVLHRDGDRPAVIDCEGGAEWWQHGRYVRNQEGYVG